MFQIFPSNTRKGALGVIVKNFLTFPAGVRSLEAVRGLLFYTAWAVVLDIVRNTTV